MSIRQSQTWQDRATCAPLPRFPSLRLLHGDFTPRRAQALSSVPKSSPFPPGPSQPTCTASTHEQRQSHVSLIYSTCTSLRIPIPGHKACHKAFKLFC